MMSILMSLVLVLGMSFPDHAAHGSSPDRPVEMSDGHYHAEAPSGHCDDGDCSGELMSMACSSMAGHCVAALPGIVRDAAPALQQVRTARIVVDDQHSPGGTPETETPPPRV